MDNPTQTSEPSTQVETGIDWTEHIPEDMKEEGYWEPLKGKPLADVLKGYGNVQKLVGNSVQLPKDTNDTEAYDKIYAKLGWNPEGKYEYDKPNVDGMEWDDSAFERFNQMAHGKRLTSDQVSSIIGWYSQELGGKMKKMSDEDSNSRAVLEAKLRQEYGPNYDYNKALAGRAAQDYFGAEAGDLVMSSATANEPLFRGMVKLGQQLAEHGVFGTNPSDTFGGPSKENAQRYIDDVNGAALNPEKRKEHPYWNPSHPGNQEAIAKYLEAMQILHPTA